MQLKGLRAMSHLMFYANTVFCVIEHLGILIDGLSFFACDTCCFQYSQCELHTIYAKATSIAAHNP